MKVACVSLFHEPSFPRDPAGFLDRFSIYRHLPQALAARGLEVRFFQHFGSEDRFLEGGVDYRFVAPGPLARLVGRALVPGRSRSRSLGEPAWRLIRATRAWQPDVVHVHGTTLHLNLALLHRATRRAEVPIVVHHHGGGMTETRRWRWLQKRNLRAAVRLVVSTQEQGDAFVRAGVPPDQIVVQMETSSAFRLRPQAEARQRTGMQGRPVFLSAGRLHPIKDPMTMLEGFARIVARWPDARLYLHYLSDELLASMRAWLRVHPLVEERVSFRGPLELAAMEDVYNSADFLLQASRREHSGVAVLDAMACGVVPVVSDLPSLRAMTRDGALAILFPPGNAEALARGVLAVPLDELPARRLAVRDHFDRTLSFACMARRLESVYRSLAGESLSSRG